MNNFKIKIARMDMPEQLDMNINHAIETGVTEGEANEHFFLVPIDYFEGMRHQILAGRNTNPATVDSCEMIFEISFMKSVDHKVFEVAINNGGDRDYMLKLEIEDVAENINLGHRFDAWTGDKGKRTFEIDHGNGHIQELNPKYYAEVYLLDETEKIKGFINEYLVRCQHSIIELLKQIEDNNKYEAVPLKPIKKAS